MKLLFSFVIVSLAVSIGAQADTVMMKTGRVFEGVVLQDSSAGVMIKLPYGTITVPKSAVSQVTRSPKAVGSSLAAPRLRIAAWNDTIVALSAQPWATGLRQIPATVIDKGVLKNVPYQSFFCSAGYEVNIYGDPDDPACIEVGKQKGAPVDTDKRLCIAFVAGLLGQPRDASILKEMDLNQEIITRNGLTLEITPPEGEDAYGGWWVSVYDEAKLDKSRAAEKELAEITVAQAAPQPLPQRASAATPRAIGEPNSDRWSDDDFRYTRPRASPASSSSGSRTYVRGYYRKNGTYVRPHSRKK
jgi:hypothetical protein